MSVFREYLVDEYVDEYEQGRLSRRDALRYLAAIVGSATLAGAVLAACTPPSRPASPPGGDLHRRPAGSRAFAHHRAPRCVRRRGRSRAVPRPGSHPAGLPRQAPGQRSFPSPSRVS